MYLGKKISVALATYNGEKYLREQLLSICNQSVIPDEIIISDDGSTDKTEVIVHEIKDLYDHKINISFIHNTRVHGVCYNFENAFLQCNGDYIFLSDQDDIWMDDKIKKVIDVFVQLPDAVCVAHDAELINQSGEPIDDILNKNINGEVLKLSKGQYAHLSKEEWLEYAVIHSMVNGMVMCVTSNFLKDALPLPNILYHDQWLCYLAVKLDGFYYLNECLAKYRLHDNNTWGNDAYRGDTLQRLHRKIETFFKHDYSYALFQLPESHNIRIDLEKSGMKDTSAYEIVNRMEGVSKKLFDLEIRKSVPALIGLIHFFRTDIRYKNTGVRQFILELIYILLTSRKKRIKNLSKIYKDFI